MAGHSKWANIRFRKGAQDAKRGKIFTKLIREITVAARMGGDDPDNNPRLRDAITKANKANMKKDTVDNAIKKGAGKLEGANYLEISYEGYGPSGVAVLVECLTDNKNRTVSEVRHAFSKYGGNLGADGSVNYLFNKVGQLVFNKDVDEEKLFELVAESGGEDIENAPDGSFVVTVPHDKYHTIVTEFEKNNFNATHAEVTMVADVHIALDESAAESVIKLLDVLEDLDDVQHVHSNAEFPETLE